jgi:hypothetical protein
MHGKVICMKSMRMICFSISSEFKLNSAKLCMGKEDI